MANSSSNSGCGCFNFIYVFIGIFTAVVGYKEIHNHLGWAIVDWLLWPFVWLKWIIFDEVNISLIKQVFKAFLS